VTGGSFLGDRCRFSSLSGDPGTFIRSVAHRSPPGELPPEALRAADVLEAAGFPWIFIETVGAGQAEVDGLRGADLKVLVHPPDAGDGMQMLKAGSIETADLHAVNKCDRPGAAAFARELRSALAPARGGEGAPVFEVSALTGQGVDALVAEIRRRQNPAEVCKEGPS
jgi:LAO/AO transport system kinase